MAEDTLVIGAPRHDDAPTEDNGAVYIFERDAMGWSQHQKLLASDKTSGAHFGRSLSLDGNRLAVGAPLDGGSGSVLTGAVYIFEHDGTSWSQSAKLTAGDDTASASFGDSVSLDGRHLAIGDMASDDAGTRSNGAVYVFEFDGAQWRRQQKLLASDRASYDGFGSSVSMDGRTLAVSARSGDGGSNDDNGAVYIFEYDGDNWAERQKLAESAVRPPIGFGISVSLEQDTLAVGAHGESHGETESGGAVYIYEYVGGLWRREDRLGVSDSSEYDAFGGSVSLDGSTLVASARRSVNSQLPGTIYVFERDDAGWDQVWRREIGEPPLSEYAGVPVVLDGGTLVVGSPHEDHDSTRNNGAVYVFARSVAD